MLRKLALFLFLICCATTCAQVSNPSIIPVTSEPASCPVLPFYYIPLSNSLYGGNGSGTCQQVNSGGGGSGFPITLGSTSIASGSTTTAVTGLTIDGVTPTIMGYVDPTSSIQTQLNGKQAALSLVAGTYVNGDLCTYASSGTLLNCNTTPGGGTTTNALTMNNSNAGVASGATFNGGSAVTLSANTLGAGSLANANTWSAANTYSAAGAASTPGLSVTGAPYTGGSATTNFPQLYVNDGAGPTTFSTAGTEFGLNAPSGFTGNMLDFHVNGGASIFKIDYLGNATAGGTTAGFIDFAQGSTSASVGACAIANSICWQAPTSVTSQLRVFAGAPATGTPYYTNSSGTMTETINPGFSTATNCSSSASPAVCGSASAGSVLIPTGTTSSTLVVNTTAVTANSQIFFYPDDTLGTKLSTTCNSTLSTLIGGSAITARTAGTSFTITFNGTIVTNGVCGNFMVVN